MALKGRAPRFTTFVFFGVIWTFLFLAIVYFGFELQPATWRWPYLVAFSIGLVLISILCVAMPVEGILEDRMAAKVARKRSPKKKIEIKWTPQARADSVIDAQIHLFNANKRSHSERDLHAWLALTLESRKNWDGREKSFYYQSTSRYSVLNPTQAPVALALFILNREDPEAAAIYRKRLEQLMAPVYELIDRNEFIAKWRETNSWTASNLPEVAKSIEESFTNSRS